MLIPTFAGCLYHFSIVPAPLRRFFRYNNLKDIPTSRELFVAIAWAVLITFIPHAIQQTFVPTPGMVLFFLWVFFLAYLRSLIFDLKDIEGDRIMGRETLVTIIGEKRVRKTIYASLGLLTTVIICFSLVYVFPKYPWPGPHTVAFLFQIPVIFYLWLFMKWNHAITSDYATLFNIFADGQFFLVGLGAWIAHLVYPS
jgi:4-hydroxy-3-methylbut-2-enyl diphosphate reductase